MKRILRRPSKSVRLVLVVSLLALGAFAIWRPRWTAGEASSMRVLCADDWLDAAALDRFARERRVRVDLYTYKDPAEFLRQLANADGRLDVICTSSLLLRSLVRNGWIRKFDYDGVARTKDLAADFLHLPYDQNFEYGLPLHWQAFGYLSPRAVDGTIKQFAGRGRVGVWATMLNYMALLTESGIQFEDRLEAEDPKRLNDEVHRFVASFTAIAPDLAHVDPASWLKRFDVAHVPSLAVPSGAGFFAPGDDGGIVDVGLLTVGERAQAPELGLDLILALTSPDAAVDQVVRSGRGTTFARGEGDQRLKPAQRPSALRATPLTKLRFPDVNAEALLKFSKMFANARASAR